MDITEVEKCLSYTTAEERDIVKQAFTAGMGPGGIGQIDRTLKTILFSTPSETGTLTV